MPQYRVRPGYRHGVGKKYGPGDTVTLTEREAVGFLDKLELVVKASKADKVAATPVEDEREEVASEPTLNFWQEPTGTVTSAASAIPTGTTGTVVSADTPEPTPTHYANFADVVGIGRETQVALHAAGYTTWEDILQAGIVKLREEFPAVSGSRMTALFTRAQREAP